MSWKTTNKKLHKWLSLLVGLQLLIWLITGLYFTLNDQKLAGGNHQRQSVVHRAAWPTSPLVEPTQLALTNVQQLELQWLLAKPVYLLTYQQGEHRYQQKRQQLIDAQSGDVITISAELASEIARRSYSGQAEIKQAIQLAPPIADLPREQNTVWQISFNDQDETAVFIDAANGQVIAHSNQHRRLNDLMFKLHFMDYGNTGGFNHGLIIAFAFATVFLALSGLIWLWQLLRSGQLLKRKKLS